jgi:hypothetical protein
MADVQAVVAANQAALQAVTAAQQAADTAASMKAQLADLNKLKIVDGEKSN